jgi:hypothetical protein
VLITTTRTGSTTELIQIVGTKNPNGIATGITGLRAFDVNEPTKYDEVTLTHERLPAAIVLRDGSLVEYDYTEPGTVGMKISLADGTIETTSFPFTTPNATLVPITLPATTAPSSVSARILNVRARVFELSGAPVNDAHVSGDWDEGRDPNGNPRIGQFSTMRTADGTYETSISLEPTPPPILENLANNAQSVCQTIQQHTYNVCQFLDPIKGLAWELAAIQACLATLPNPALAAACVTAATTVKLFCANTGQVCKLLAFMIDLFPKGPVLLHTQASGPLFFKNDQQMVTLPYPDPVAVDFTIPNRPAAEERAVLGEAPFDSIITWTATRNDLPCWPGESNGSTDIYKVFHGVSYEPLVPLLRKWGKWVPASASKPSPTGSLTSSLDATGVVTTIFVDTQTYVSGTSTDTWDYQITETVDLNKGYYSRDYIGHRVMISHTWCGVSKWEAFDHGTQNGPLPVTMVPIAK